MRRAACHEHDLGILVDCALLVWRSQAEVSSKTAIGRPENGLGEFPRHASGGFDVGCWSFSMNIGTFLPTYVLVEDAAHHDSVRADVLCAGIVRSALRVKTDLGDLLACYGTATAPHRPILCAKEPFLPGFKAYSSSLVGQHG